MDVLDDFIGAVEGDVTVLTTIDTKLQASAETILVEALAAQGATVLKVRWKSTSIDGLSSDAVSAAMHMGLDKDAEAIVGKVEGDTALALAGAARVFEADYEVPYLCHAPMEPWSVTVEPTADGGLEIWGPFQTQDRNRNTAAKTAGIDPSKVILHTLMLGGGYGRRLGDDGTPGAVVVALAVKKPVKFFWRREDEIGQGWYRPAQVARLRAGIDANGRIIKSLPLGTAGRIDAVVPQAKAPTLFARFGNILPLGFAGQLVRNPGQFDVIVTGNLFGDILSDQASMCVGSIGMLPSASLDAAGKGLYEPIHGSAPDIAGQGKANPSAAILSAAMMLRYSLDMAAAADRIEAAVGAAIGAGARTADLGGSLSTRAMGDATAIHKMTGRVAQVFGMADRGVIRPGAFADLVLFDPATVKDAADFDHPTRPAIGILETWVEQHQV
eukprot:gene40033-54123_t